MKKLSFPKKLRLLSSHEFISVFKNSNKIITKEITIFFNINNLKHPRIGIVIPKKYVKNAYNRNNIKRHIRENFRIHQHVLPNMDFIITIQKNIIILDNYHLNNKFKNIWLFDYDANI